MYDMFKRKIDILFIECSEEVRDYLAKAFSYLYDKNELDITNIFDMLCKIKEVHPELKIAFSSKSEFDSKNNVINLSRKNYLVLMHEIGHAIHYYANGYKVPNEFHVLQQTLLNNPEIIENSKHVISFLDQYIRKITNEVNNTDISDQEYDYLLLEQKRFLETKDFVDALLGGITGSGHGRAYYSKDEDKSIAFSEMFANFVAIKSLKDSNQVLAILMSIFGRELIEVFENLYQEMQDFYKNDGNQKQ